MADESNVRDATLLILQNIQSQLGEIRTRLDRVETGQAVVREEMESGFRAVREDMATRVELGALRDEMRKEFAAVRDELRVGFKATMKQNDRRFLDHEARIRALERRR
jgi:hypothetical protein